MVGERIRDLCNVDRDLDEGYYSILVSTTTTYFSREFISIPPPQTTFPSEPYLSSKEIRYRSLYTTNP